MAPDGKRQHKIPKRDTKQNTSLNGSNSILTLASLLRSLKLTLPGYLVVKPSLSATTVSYPPFSFPSPLSKIHFSSIAHGSRLAGTRIVLLIRFILPTLLQPVATTIVQRNILRARGAILWMICMILRIGIRRTSKHTNKQLIYIQENRHVTYYTYT